MVKLGAILVSRESAAFQRRACANLTALGHCYLMTENLQKAYDAYQQALVNLRDPKVGLVIHCNTSPDALTRSRTPCFGTVSVSCMTDMAAMTMPRRLSPKSCRSNLSSKRPTKFISALE